MGFKPKIKMIVASQELLAVSKEARRVSAQGLRQGTYLRSQAKVAVAQESESETRLLQSQGGICSSARRVEGSNRTKDK